ncbi:MAG: hypothetical protein E7C82_05085 [Anaerococcus hydrogenalis]|uniref:hypothetical protein n=1 Tax=Anaerococcus hydrogenalis TaxID=33029 RepID=UPI002900E51B|nr:hypothetical protein [Anaerococcus hydrogenalis]MDU2583063.1 hypothetical protein [Anaerococcus hydrogenalis]
MKNIFRIGMIILCAVIAIICFRRNDMVFAVISAIFGILFAYKIVSDNNKEVNK